MDSSLELIKVTCFFFFKLTAALVFNWMVDSNEVDFHLLKSGVILLDLAKST